MKILLSENAVRALGALLEKESTTPENYPLSLNALTNACNQKTNREPVLSLSENAVLDAIEELVRHGLVSRRGGAGSRVDKFAHRLNNRLTDEYDFDASERAVLCVLMLRGPQTIGEIRQRCTRLHTFEDSDALAAVLETLAEREDGPFVSQLARQSGHKEARFVHLWSGEPDPSLLIEIANRVDDTPSRVQNEARIDRLEAQLAALGARVDRLEHELGVSSETDDNNNNNDNDNDNVIDDKK